MKLLTLIRHAKSSWDAPGLSDHERPLNDRGLKAAPLIGEKLAERGFQPEWILSSTAVRAYTTAQIIAEKLGLPDDRVGREADIYGAGTSELLRVVSKGIDEKLEHVVLIGHNPGFEEFADFLIKGGGPGHLATCAVVRMELDIDHWGEADEDCARLIEHLYPKMFV